MITIVTPQLATAASMLVRLTRSDDRSLCRALERAEERLISLPWSVDGGVLCISSHSSPGQVHFCDGDTCDCLTTRGVCWHRAAFVILSTIAATGALVVANLPLPAPDAMRQIEDGDYPGSFLDSLDELAFDEDGGLLPAQPVRLKAIDPRTQAKADEIFA